MDRLLALLLFASLLYQVLHRNRIQQRCLLENTEATVQKEQKATDDQPQIPLKPFGLRKPASNPAVRSGADS